MITVAALVVGLSGCIGRPDLSNKAEEIAGVIAALPGVDDVDDYYQNGFTSGLSLTYRVTMAAGASDAEVVNVASTVNSEVGDEFDGYDRELTLTVGDLSVVLNGEPNVDELRQRLLGLKNLNSSLVSGVLTWKENDDTGRDNELEIREASQDPFTVLSAVRDQVLSAVRDQFGTEQVHVKVSDAEEPAWKVAFPYSEQAQNRLAAAIRSVNVEFDEIEISQNRVTDVEAHVDDTANVSTRLMTVIDTVNKGTSAPWEFRWSAGQPSAGQGNLASGGRVSVGACAYYEDSPREKDPAKYLTPEAIAVQDQLRSKYDTCG
ncbi:MAG: hypothetical protein L0I80_01980 [Brevibacterium sp.]|nr:hypothetical protein [Brevibacterium sp.]MDN6132954.1 hypothetical protein [Brevibacterium sp.]MDN6191671.1 hypothetical protein [Brevibacterium sp.]MDN6529347.1 hypothetical protein [Brevibacterium sp.]MDN6667276.1 hypothetical protein [Brevibacterium sp.]